VISPRVVALTEGVLKAMILTKLKVISVVVLAVSLGVGVAGWSYGVAGPPSQQTGEERAARLAERPAADELGALRLEMEALRKEVRATRARVQVLEAEVRGQKGKDTNLPQSARYSQSFNPLALSGLTSAEYRSITRYGSERPYDVFAEAEAALKKLRENPRDKQAAKALEQATQWLKARTETEEKGNHNPRNH
jgi:hypothetical protein